MNHISKKVAFLGFIGLLLSSAVEAAVRIPRVQVGEREVIAEREIGMPGMPKMPGAPTPEFFKGWSKEALSKRVENAGKSIQKGLKDLQACFMGKKECSRNKINALRGALAVAITLAIVAAAEKFGGVYAPSYAPQWARAGLQKTKQAAGTAAERARQARQARQAKAEHKAYWEAGGPDYNTQ